MSASALRLSDHLTVVSANGCRAKTGSLPRDLENGGMLVKVIDEHDVAVYIVNL